ncbi:MAG: polysaccharide deacetylase family protein [Desulfobacterales bacterium]|nr:MAG: polysaccharide deacetylase family protein [Desulfobacterales bacterium]
MQETENRRKAVLIDVVILCFLLLLTGCLIGQPASTPEISSEQPATTQFRVFNDFVVVKTTEKDTLSSLAAKYLNDSEKDWLLAEFNDIDHLKPGQDIIIPLKPFQKGGLQTEGYQTVPVLAYKSFSKDKPGLMSVTETAFEAQMKYLKENGFHVITVRQLLDFFDFKGQIPEKSVVITIDDGWYALYDIAYPILKKYGFSSTLFVYTDFIGGGKAMSWGQLKELSENGFDIQCKTRTHRNMKRLRENETFKEYVASIEMELAYPKTLIKKRLGKECSYLAYPYGETNNLVIELLKKQGYRAAFTVRGKSNPFFTNRFRIYRSEVYGHDDIETFKEKLTVFERMKLE